jgi:phage shock protein A
MGLLSRMTTAIKAKMNRLIDAAENPNETLDYSYERQLEMLRNVKRGVVEVVTSRRRLQMQAARIQQDIDRLDDQARQALSAGREDLAKGALQRKQMAIQQIQGLDEQIGGLEQEEQRLTAAEQRLSSKVAAFRVQKEVIKAQYTAAEAQVKIGESLSGISEEMADVGLAADRAMQKTESMRARASAIDELTESGMLESPLSPEDRLGRELQQIAAQQSVEGELEAMKRQLSGGSERPKLSGGEAA